MSSFRIYLISLPLFVFSVFITTCAPKNITVDMGPLRFAVIGNTYPESPFQVTGERLRDIVKEINKDNPVFIIHIGDMIFGGRDSVGIKRDDIDRQFSRFFRCASALGPAMYTVIGDKDLFNGSSEMHARYSKCRPYYSFNYGRLHFIILNSTDKTPGEIGSEQFGWLAGDLTAYKDSPAIIVFIHHPVIVPKKAGLSSEQHICKDPDRLHKILEKYPVKAVISGELSAFYQERKGGIDYFILGCGGYNESDRYKNYINYYIIDYISGDIKITPQKIQ
jgi:acid phosphatase type 7